MGVTFNIRHVEQDDLDLKGELSADELHLDASDEVVHVTGPLRYDLTAQRLEGGILVSGSLNLGMKCDCVRCLKNFDCPLDLHDWTCHLPLVGEDAVKVDNDVVDLTPYIREDILLALPQHPLCKPECGGIEMPSEHGHPGGKSGQTPSAWDELDKLKL